jgi:hypothetical protein
MWRWKGGQRQRTTVANSGEFSAQAAILIEIRGNFKSKSLI